MEKITKYIDENRQRFLDELFDFIRIPSVSAKPEHKKDMIRATEYVKKKLLEAGADKAEVFTTQGHPIVYGEKMVDRNAPTVLVYGHYDVQPAEPFELWDSPPFEPEIRDEKIYARGADDDKGQLFMHVRGLSYMEVEVTGPNRDLHSGLYGGAVANPANVLAKMIASLTDENNHITIPGFYEDVLEVSREERDEMAKRPFNLDEFKQSIDIDRESGEEEYSTLERTGIRPSLDVNGIWGGFTGEGAKTILPSKASAKISMRLVPNQKSKKIDKLFEDHFKSIAPDGVKVKVKSLHGAEGYVSPIDTVAYQAASKACEVSFGKKPIPVRSGGSIPIISEFEQVLGVKSILLGFGLDADAIHSPNENYPLFNFFKGIETIPVFFRYFAKMMK